MPKIVKPLTDKKVATLRHGTVRSIDKAKIRSVGNPCPAYHAVGGATGLITRGSSLLGILPLESRRHQWLVSAASIRGHLLTDSSCLRVALAH